MCAQSLWLYMDPAVNVATPLNRTPARVRLGRHVGQPRSAATSAYQAPLKPASPGPDQAHFVTAGENIAFAPDVDQAYESLLASPDHRANLLNPDFKCVGIGVYRAVGYEEMFTQDFSDCA